MYFKFSCYTVNIILFIVLQHLVVAKHFEAMQDEASRADSYGMS